jgi:AraC family transcriptional regulator
MQAAATLTARSAGSVLRGRDLDGLCVEEVVMPAHLSVPEHRHEGAQVYFLLEGEYAETARGAEHPLAPGGAWFRPPLEPHRNRVRGGDPALILIVTVEERRFRSAERRAASPRRLGSLILEEVKNELVREIRRGDDAGTFALEGWALLLLARTERLLCAGPRPPEWLSDASSFIEHAYAEPLSLAGVAAHVRVHPATLAAAFRRYLHTSVGTYIRDVRLERAKTALLETKTPIKEIAAETGFFDQAHFGRSFRRRFGAPPAAFRACLS